MGKAFDDARRDWDSGLQVQWPIATLSNMFRLTEIADDIERGDDTRLNQPSRGAVNCNFLVPLLVHDPIQ